mmetsp:Transcript_63025/g.100132  ORF Transcript_63025/g.100132 Transcript_63025/m.100132 type:complete len:326 (+) Transcript_63025:47-1024(+)
MMAMNGSTQLHDELPTAEEYMKLKRWKDEIAQPAIDKNEEYQLMVDEFHVKIEHMSLQIEEYSKEVSKLKNEKQDLEAEVASLNKLHSHSINNDDVLSKTLQEKEEEVEALQNQCEKLQQGLRSTQEAMRELSTQNEQLRSDNVEYGMMVDELRSNMPDNWAYDDTTMPPPPDSTIRPPPDTLRTMRPPPDATLRMFGATDTPRTLPHGILYDGDEQEADDMQHAHDYDYAAHYGEVEQEVRQSLQSEFEMKLQNERGKLLQQHEAEVSETMKELKRKLLEKDREIKRLKVESSNLKNQNRGNMHNNPNNKEDLSKCKVFGWAAW